MEKTNAWLPEGNSEEGQTGRLGLTYIHYYTQQIMKKDPRYSKGNSTQYSVMAYMGNEFLKK